MRLGTDILIDAYMDQQQFDRFERATRDQHVVDLDLRDAERTRQQTKEIERLAKENPEAFRPKTIEEREQDKSDKMDELYPTATVLTEEEVREELKKISEDEKI